VFGWTHDTVSATNSLGPYVCPVDVTLRALPLFAHTLCHYSSTVRVSITLGDLQSRDYLGGCTKVQLASKPKMIRDLLIGYLMTVSVWDQIDKDTIRNCIPSHTESQNGNLFILITLMMNMDGTYL
jgi:hypothetical protein